MGMEIRLSGTGGQGLILAGIILAEAAGIYDYKYVTQTQSYGPEARGGASKSDVIISDQEILRAQILNPDFLVCLSEQAYERYGATTLPGATIIYDTLFVSVSDIPGVRQIPVPATETALSLGTKIVANVVALGALRSISDAVSWESLRKAVLARAPKGSEDINLKALEAGKLLAPLSNAQAATVTTTAGKNA